MTLYGRPKVSYIVLLVGVICQSSTHRDLAGQLSNKEELFSQLITNEEKVDGVVRRLE